ncbi:MAG: hypothetical protein AAF587_06580 [Bacteroidota bacterium]
MRKSDLSTVQLRDLNVFNLLLEHHGWSDDENLEFRLDSGEKVTPEGFRAINHGGIGLEARYHAPVNMISLKIIDQLYEDKVQFHFLFDDRPERILEWIADISGQLSLESYPELLKQADGKCEMILLEVSDTEIYEVKPPTSV